MSPSDHTRSEDNLRAGSSAVDTPVTVPSGPLPAGLLAALAIGVGGSLGALARVGLDHWLGGGLGGGFGGGLGGGPPSTSALIVTLVINTLGALGLGLLRRPHARTRGTVLYSGVSVGFLGAFTTWSAVMVQLALLQGQGSWMLGWGYLLATLVLGLSAAWWGLRSGVGKKAVIA